MRQRVSLVVLRLLVLPAALLAAPQNVARADRASRSNQTVSTIDVTVHEGTSMAIALSPDKRRIAIDLQGTLWTLPASGGTATGITDEYNDARQPSWAPDGARIASSPTTPSMSCR